MSSKEKGFSCEQAKNLDMVEYLSKMGYEPKKIRGADYWYVSPLRSERTASFKVNRKLNRWYDHGEGRGGNLIDFAILYHNCTVGFFLKSLNGDLSFHQPLRQPLSKPFDQEENAIHILEVSPLKSLSLIRYLHSRNIPLSLAETYCKEVRFEMYQKPCFSIGFANDKGGYELRNSFLKSSSSPKGVTTYDNGSQEVAVFEGFFDFLSFLVLHRGTEGANMNFCILNSLSFFEGARPFMEEHAAVHLYLDNDTAGQNCSLRAAGLSAKYTDESRLYKGYKDLNEWHTGFGKRAKRRGLKGPT